MTPDASAASPADNSYATKGQSREADRPSGVFSHQALIDAIQTIGIDNVMFSIDDPFESTEPAAEFMRTAPLAHGDKERVVHANAERILRLNP